jgi:hypothetical protein
VADDPPVTRFAVAHPWLWGLVAGVLAAALALRLFPGEWWPWAAALAFGLANALAWRPNGPAHRVRAWLVRRYPKRE